MEKADMTRTKSYVIALGLAALVFASATMPSIAAPLASSAAALRAAASDSDDVTQVRQRSRRGWHRGSGFRSFGRAFGYSRGYGYGGSRDSPAATGGGSLGYNRGIHAN
jgi:hypothetical protein